MGKEAVMTRIGRRHDRPSRWRRCRSCSARPLRSCVVTERDLERARKVAQRKIDLLFPDFPDDRKTA